MDREALIVRWRSAQSVLVVTGAGISLASGIPTFRGTDPGAVWAHEVLEKGTWSYFRRDPVGSWSFYIQRFDSVFGAKPNPAHTALVDLEQATLARGARFLLVTQNVDGLHHQAGSQALVEVHGMARRLRCSARGCENAAPRGSLPLEPSMFDAFKDAPSKTTLPRCPACGAPLRAHVLWFDETYDQHVDYQIQRVVDAAWRADLIVFVGTSFSVGVTELILQAGRASQASIWSIDPGEAERLHGVISLREKAEELLPAVAGALA